jgi:hypothetical protein
MILRVAGAGHNGHSDAGGWADRPPGRWSLLGYPMLVTVREFSFGAGFVPSDRRSLVADAERMRRTAAAASWLQGRTYRPASAGIR